MAGEPILAHGTVVNQNYIPVANRVDIKLKPPAKEKVDVTHHASTARVYNKAFGSGGEVTFQVFYHPDNESHLDLRDAHDSGDASLFQVVMADGTAIDFAAYVMLEGFDLGVANKPQLVDVKLEITGSMSWDDP